MRHVRGMSASWQEGSAVHASGFIPAKTGRAHFEPFQEKIISRRARAHATTVSCRYNEIFIRRRNFLVPLISRVNVPECAARDCLTFHKRTSPTWSSWLPALPTAAWKIRHCRIPPPPPRLYNHIIALSHRRNRARLRVM